jgi:hypothetical protein
VRVLHAAVKAFPATDSAVRARLLAYQGLELVWSGDWYTRVGLSDEALAIARRIGDPDTLALVLYLRFMTVWAASTFAERLTIVAEAEELVSRLDDRTLAFHVAYSGCHAAMETGDMELVDRLLASAGRLSEQLHQPLLEWRVLFMRAGRAMVAGDLQQGELLAFEAFVLGERAGQPDAASAFSTQVFNVRLHQGRLGELATVAKGGFGRSADTGSVPWVAQMGEAVVYCEMDKPDEARGVFDTVMAGELQDVPNDYGWLPTVALGALVCAYLRDARRGKRLYELLRPYEAQCVTLGPSWLGSTAHYLGLMAATIGDHEQAERHFATAMDAHARAMSPVWNAHTQLAWGAALLESDDRRDSKRADGLLKGASDIAMRLGMAGVERRVRSVTGHS